MGFYSGTPKLCLGLLLSLSQECQTAVLKLLLRSLMVYPQNLGVHHQGSHCPQNCDTKSAEYWSGHAVLMGTHNIGFYEELGKIIIKYSSSVKSDKVALMIYNFSAYGIIKRKCFANRVCFYPLSENSMLKSLLINS